SSAAGFIVIDDFRAANLLKNLGKFVLDTFREQNRDGPADSLISTIPIDSFCSTVPGNNFPIQSLADNCIIRRFYDCCQVGLALLQPLSLGDIPDDAVHPDRQ